MAAASISLTYSLHDGTEYQGSFIRNGIVNAFYLSCYKRAELDCEKLVATGHALAHAYGEYGSSFACSEYTELAEVLNSTVDYIYYCRQTPQRREFAYRFNEYNEQYSYPHFTNRIITAWSGACFSYIVTGMVKVPDVSGDDQGKKYEIWQQHPQRLNHHP